jgi:hypothetical protein
MTESSCSQLANVTWDSHSGDCENTVLLNVMPCSLVERYQSSRGTCYLQLTPSGSLRTRVQDGPVHISVAFSYSRLNFYPEEGGRKCLRNTGDFPEDNSIHIHLPRSRGPGFDSRRLQIF